MPNEPGHNTSQLTRFQLTERDDDILNCLTHKVRMFSIEQVGRTWWWGNRYRRSDAMKRLRKLEKFGLVEIFDVLAHPELELRRPIMNWVPGMPQTNFSKLSYLLKQRWPNSHQTTTVVAASSKAASRYGGQGGRRPRRSEMTHDLHVSTVYLSFRVFRIADARDWICEDVFDSLREKRKGDKLPDAVLEKDDGLHAVEFGGAYEKSKLQSFHDWCLKKRMTYEIW